METLFDGLRKGKGRADERTVRLLLDACDVFKAHLARLKAGERGNDPAMDALRAQLIGYRAGQRREARRKADASVTRQAEATEESFFDDGPEATVPPREPRHGLRPLRRRAGAPRRAPAAKATRSSASSSPTAAAAEQNRRKGDPSSIRVSVEKIDRIVNLVGELVIAQAMMQQSVGNARRGSRTSTSPTASPPSTATRATCSRR